MIKPIGRHFGVWLLLALALGMSIKSQPVAACVCISAALIFDAIKTK